MIRADEPRSKQRKRTLTRLKIGFACLVALWLGFAIRGPYRAASRMDAENERLEQRNADLKMKNQSLRREAAAVAMDAGMEREARRLGYVRKGEEPLVIPK